jgi:hypothetical protein
MKTVIIALMLVLTVALSAGLAGDKVIVHHNGEDEMGNPIVEDICVSVNSVDKHVANHGDTTEMVPCQGDPDPEPEPVE